MNYRHAFHAGNFADCMKHALLLWLLGAMQRKPGAVLVLDTHAGIGRYDLSAGPAERTGEWRTGIAPLLNEPPEALADYVRLVRELGLYPGSPVLLRARLRPQDRLVCCELHPEDHALLQREFRRDSQVAVHLRDAWETLGALLPAPEKRALVLIDPPYEAPREFEQVARGLATALRRMPNAVVAAWYPIKHRAPVRAFHTALRESGLRDIVAAELLLREPVDASRLNGCGLVVANPPFGFENAATSVLAGLAERLAVPGEGGGFGVERLVDE
jgi:23S rRNA (adenine2030-N6)-methyltransferase